MAVLLKNLIARSPQTDDLAVLSELVALCESSEESTVGSSLEDLLSQWQRPDFHLASDAWVIVTTRGQIVGFACVWHEDQAEILTFICVHPEHRNRGIGTLLLRMVELKARESLRLAPSGARVILRGLIGKANKGAQSLFEREGFQPGRQFLRISYTLAEDTGESPAPQTQKKLRTDIFFERGRLLGATPLYDRDGLCSVHIYKTYEKELSLATQELVAGKELESLGAC